MPLDAGCRFVTRDRYEIRPGPAVKRVIDLPENASHNRALLQTQVRVSGGATEAANMMGENGRMTWQRVKAVLNPQWCRSVPAPKAARQLPEVVAAADGRADATVRRGERDLQLLGILQRLAMAGDEMPFLADLALRCGLTSGTVVGALSRLEGARDIVLELTAHRPGLKRQARITVHGHGILKTAGWVGV